MIHPIASIITTAWLVLRLLVLAGIPAAIVTRLIIAVVRFAVLPAAAKRNYPAALWAKFRWRWLTRNLGLAYLDQHRRAAQPVPFGTSVRVREQSAQPARLRFPRAHIRADAFGIVASVKTVPKVGRAEFEKHASYFADAWKCHRVQVSQPRPGRLTVRGLRLDPLTLPLPADQVPPVYGSSSVQDQTPNAFGVSSRQRVTNLRGIRNYVSRPDLSRDRVTNLPLRLYLGRDEWGQDRWLPLAGITGITVGGLPGYGKTSFINSILCQLAGLPVQLVLIDGKGGGDYSDWERRAWIVTGDSLPAAAAGLEDTHALMRSRFGTVLEQTGHRNAWHRGPTEDFPIILTVIDECHTFFDLEAVKGDREAERQVRTCRTMAGQLIKKGRSVLMISILITQKQTSDAVPTALRDNCGFAVSFATKTTDASVAALGEQIRQCPTFDPVTLQGRPDYIGVCTAALPTGADPFVRLRVPEITEEAAAARALETAPLRRALTATPAPPVAAESPAPPALEPAAAKS